VIREKDRVQHYTDVDGISTRVDEGQLTMYENVGSEVNKGPVMGDEGQYTTLEYVMYK